jgi:hypothetical protein
MVENAETLPAMPPIFPPPSENSLTTNGETAAKRKPGAAKKMRANLVADTVACPTSACTYIHLDILSVSGHTVHFWTYRALLGIVFISPKTSR